MTWEPTEEEVQKYMEAHEKIDLEPYMSPNLYYAALLRAAWAVSPGPGLEAALKHETDNRRDQVRKKRRGQEIHKQLRARVAELKDLVGGWYASAHLRGLCPSNYDPRDPFYPDGEILGRGETARLRGRVAELEARIERAKKVQRYANCIDVSSTSGEVSYGYEPVDGGDMMLARFVLAALTPTKEETDG